ncbi:MAG: bifunctional oligoribonuclease/PAP phosphatase NrnA [Clostridia bacterium]|nr:bifunctional oligoribonuclease/PAP phosphatase NrnA [Clostridia bacterium]
MDSFLDKIKKAKKIAIFSHVRPDADALCSSFALKNLIKHNFEDKFVDVFNDGPIGELYDQILKDEVINPKQYQNYDLAFVLDCPTLERIGKCKEIINDIPTIINIDHHETNSKFGNINIVTPLCSSTCELIYLMAKGRQLKLNSTVAKQLYQGIITDTNCFSSFSTTALTHRVTSELCKYKFDSNAIKRYYFKNNTLTKTKLVSTAFSSLKLYKGAKFITMKIPYKAFEETGATFDDTLGIVDNGINIGEAEASAILIESEPNKIHVSLRSKGNVNVGEIAKALGGGGSVSVAAYQKNGELKEIEKQLVATVTPYLCEDKEKEEIIF